MIYKFSGKLSMPEDNDLNAMKYIFSDYRTANIKSYNLTKALRAFENKEIGLVLHYHRKDIFCEVGKLYRYQGVWMINGVCIDHKLWDLTGEIVTVIFDDMQEDMEEFYGELLQKVF